MARRVHVVPHTHWDREWYSPFQTFRYRLVEAVDALLEVMEGDPSFSRFLLDGQMAAVDDYLEVRPENAERLRRLAAAGRVACGPWYVLMDEFLVSGETMVRNLLLGLERAAAFGGAMEVGYLPDMFGHIAQMPQLLRLGGMSDAVVWRGVPASITTTGFIWEAPDGSGVRTEYLPRGYSLGGRLADDAKGLIRRVDAFLEAHPGFLPGDQPALFPAGGDHQPPAPWLGRVVDEADAMQDRYDLRLSSLAEALADMPRDGLPVWRGELRSGARANVLMGVASNRLDVKRAAARAERSVETLAEPLATCYLPPSRFPAALLGIAWREIIRNAAHDSICACSHDEVVSAVLARFVEARQLGEAVVQRVSAAASLAFATEGSYVLNPSSHTRSGTVELLLAGEGPLEGAQVLSSRVGLAGGLVLSAAELRGILGQIDSYQLREDAFVNDVIVTEEDERIDIELVLGPQARSDLPVDDIKAGILEVLDRRPDTPISVRLDLSPARQVLVRMADVPGFGWKRFEPAPLEHPVSVSGDGLTMSNGLCTLTVSAADGSFSLDGVGGFNRLVDSGDHGDTYNYSPPEHDAVVDEPESVEVATLEEGPVRGRIRVLRRYRWPERIDDASRSRAGSTEVEIASVLELHAGERLVRVETSFDNPARDHRLRAEFPVPGGALESEAECAFDVVRRGLEAEGGPTERPLATYPSRRFVKAGRLLVVHEGLPEYELVELGEDGRAGALALTILRSTGMLSRLTMLNRPLPAGPTDPLEGPQMIGPWAARYAVGLLAADDGDRSSYDACYEAASVAFTPLPVVDALGTGLLPESGSHLVVSGGGVQVSALRRLDGDLVELRAFNPNDTPTSLSLESRDRTPVRGSVVDLRGRFLAAFAGSMPMGPHEIVTLRFDLPLVAAVELPPT